VSPILKIPNNGSDPGLIANEPVNKELTVELNVKYNTTPTIDIIEATRGKENEQTGVLWMISNHEGKEIWFIAIDWRTFVNYYKEDQNQPSIRNDTIRQRFRPSKNKKTWWEVDREEVRKYNLTPPPKKYNIYIYVQLWIENNFDPPPAINIRTKRKRQDSNEHEMESPKKAMRTNEQLPTANTGCDFTLPLEPLFNIDDLNMDYFPSEDRTSD